MPESLTQLFRVAVTSTKAKDEVGIITLHARFEIYETPGAEE
jgi:hypothetical protein